MDFRMHTVDTTQISLGQTFFVRKIHILLKSQYFLLMIFFDCLQSGVIVFHIVILSLFLGYRFRIFCLILLFLICNYRVYLQTLGLQN